MTEFADAAAEVRRLNARKNEIEAEFRQLSAKAQAGPGLSRRDRRREAQLREESARLLEESRESRAHRPPF